MNSIQQEDYPFSFYRDPLSEIMSSPDPYQSNYNKDTNYTLDLDIHPPEDHNHFETMPDPDEDYQEKVKSKSSSKKSKPKRKYVHQEHSSEFRQGKWTIQEEKLYNQFIARYASGDSAWSTKNAKTKRTNYFICMSKFIKTRSQTQCRSYEQKRAGRKSNFSNCADSSPATTDVPEKCRKDTSVKIVYKSISDFSPVSSCGMNECQCSTVATNCSPFEPGNFEYRVDSYLNFNVQENNCSLVKSRLESTSISNLEKLLFCSEKMKESRQDGMSYPEELMKIMRRKMLNTVEKMPSDAF